MLERTVNFDDKNSWSDFGVIFKTLVISPPEPRLVMIDVPYRNGLVDETDYFGDVTYANRNLKMDFLVPNGTIDHHAVYSNVLNTLHGKRKQIRYSADDGWYYEGRLQVSDYSVSDGYWGFSIEASVDPYKYRDISTFYNVMSGDLIESQTEEDITDEELLNIIKEQVELSRDIIVVNNEMKSIPTISLLEKKIALTFENTTYILTAGTHKGSALNPPIILKKGENHFSINSFGKYAKILVEFREGRL